MSMDGIAVSGARAAALRLQAAAGNTARLGTLASPRQAVVASEQRGGGVVARVVEAGSGVAAHGLDAAGGAAARGLDAGGGAAAHGLDAGGGAAAPWADRVEALGARADFQANLRGFARTDEALGSLLDVLA